MSDVNVPKGQSQGDRAAFEERAVQAAPPGAQPGLGGGGGGPSPEQLLASAGASPINRLRGPSTRPDEPLTAGLDSGLGPGPSSRPTVAGPPKQDNSVAYLTAYMPAIELIASSANASSGMRQWARRLRAAQPPGAQKNRPEANPRNPV